MKYKALPRVAACLLLIALIGAPASAQVARIFLSGTGSDAGDCSNAATPCRSLQVAVDQCPANGEVIVVSSGGYGSAVIDHPVTVNAPPGVTAFARSIAVNAGNVTLRGLTLNGAVSAEAVGINFTGTNLVVDRCVLNGYQTAISNDGVGLLINDSEFRNNSQYALRTISVTFKRYMAVENSRFVWDRGTPSGAGLVINEGMQAAVRGSTFAGLDPAVRVARAEGTSVAPQVEIDTCVFTANTKAVEVMGGVQLPAEARIGDSTISANYVGLARSGAASVVSYGTNRLWGNTIDGTFTSTLPRN